MEPQEFDLKYCAGLNEQQLAAVHAAEGAVLLLAVPVVARPRFSLPA